jgi:hypothetical protein
MKGITERQGYNLEKILCEWPIPPDQLLVHMPLAAAPEELSAVPSRAISHCVAAEPQKFLYLVLELNFPYDTHPVFSATDSVKEALGQTREPFLATDNLAVLCIDLSNSGIPGCLSYCDLETHEVLKLNPQS